MEVFSEVLWTGFFTLLFSVAFVRRSPASIVFACTLIAAIAVDPWYSTVYKLIVWFSADEQGLSSLVRNDWQRFHALQYSWRLTLNIITAIAAGFVAKRFWKLDGAGRIATESNAQDDQMRSQLSIRAIFVWITLSAWYVKALQNPSELFETITVLLTISLLALATAHAAKTKSATTVIFLCVALTFFYFPPMGRFRRELVLKLGHTDQPRIMEAFTILRHGVAIMTSATIAVFGAAFLRQVRTNPVARLAVGLALLAVLYLASYDFLGVERYGPHKPMRVFSSNKIAVAYRPAAWLESLWLGQEVWIGDEKEYDASGAAGQSPLNSLLPLQLVKP